MEKASSQVAVVLGFLAHSLAMEILILLFLLVILTIPTLLMNRRQRAKMAEIQSLQDALQPGDKVVTTAGLHATVMSVSEELVTLEIAPGLVTTWEKLAVVRVVAHAGEVYGTPGPIETPDSFSQYPDTHPENDPRPEDEDRSQGHPENR